MAIRTSKIESSELNWLDIKCQVQVLRSILQSGLDGKLSQSPAKTKKFRESLAKPRENGRNRENWFLFPAQFLLIFYNKFNTLYIYNRIGNNIYKILFLRGTCIAGCCAVDVNCRIKLYAYTQWYLVGKKYTYAYN